MDAESLLRILRTYDASCDAAAVRAAFSGPESAEFVRWAAVHLTPDTLLSPDELNQYAALEEAGLAEQLAMKPGLSESRVLSSQEIKDAIGELNRSTEAITRHTEMLKQQQESLDRLVNAARQGREERAAVEAGQARKWESHRRDLELLTDELFRALNSRVAGLEQHNSAAGARIQQTTDALLHSDDKLLASLQKLGWELETEDAEEQEDVALLRETCARLIKLTVEGIRTKLDRIYLESLESSAESAAADSASADEVSAVQQELESLYSEILPVAQMSVEQQFLDPALKSLAAKKSDDRARSARATGYIHDCLDYLLDRAHDLMARLEAFRAYQVAAGAVLDIAKAELTAEAAPAAETLPTRKTSVSQQNTIMSPVRPPRAEQKPRYSIGAPGIEPPLDEILRTLAITLPGEEEGPAGVQAQIKELASTLANRRAKLEDVAQNVQEWFESAATRQVADAKLAIQLVRDSVLAESQFGEVRLVDPGIDGSISVLSQELANVGERLKSVEASVARLRGKNPKRDELISRWGS